MNKPQIPHRAFTLELKVGADTRADLARALEHLAFEIDREQLTTGCWGTPSDGGTYSLRIDHEMTHERYHAENHAYLAALKDQQP